MVSASLNMQPHSSVASKVNYFHGKLLDLVKELIVLRDHVSKYIRVSPNMIYVLLDELFLE